MPPAEQPASPLARTWLRARAWLHTRQSNFTLELPCWRQSGSRRNVAWIQAKTTLLPE